MGDAAAAARAGGVAPLAGVLVLALRGGARPRRGGDGGGGRDREP